jgi:phosphoribosylanthranilate isomerase
MKVKICGITNRNDALCAVELGADALGFIFVESSPRYVPPADAKDIIRVLPPFVVPVGVFVNTTRDEIHRIAEEAGIRCAQLHGDERPEEMTGLAVPAYKSFRVDGNFDPEVIHRYPGPAYLLDTRAENARGGTGKIFDWNIAIEAKAYGRIILAGGLGPENIAKAVQTVLPYAVDVNSGAEEFPGKKDPKKLRQLFRILRRMEIEEYNAKETTN